MGPKRTGAVAAGGAGKKSKKAGSAAASVSGQPEAGLTNAGSWSEGHGTCAICHASSRSAPWAAARHDKTSGEAIPVGEVCKSCYEIFEARRGRDGDMTFDSFVEKAQRDRTFRSEIEKAKAVKAGTAKRDFAAEQATESATMALEWPMSYIALTERELMRHLGLQRLPKYVVKDVPQLMLPPMDDHMKLETHYIFKHPQRPYREASLKSIGELRRDKYILPQSSQLYAGHGDSAISEGRNVFLKDAARAKIYERGVQGNLMTLEGFAEQVENSTNTAPPGCNNSSAAAATQDEEHAEDFDDGASLVSGPAASMFAESLVNFGKKSRPPVPAFGSGASDAGGLRPSPTKSVVSFGGDDDEDNEEDEEQKKIVQLPGRGGALGTPKLIAA